MNLNFRENKGNSLEFFILRLKTAVAKPARFL